MFITTQIQFSSDIPYFRHWEGWEKGGEGKGGRVERVEGWQKRGKGEGGERGREG